MRLMSSEFLTFLYPIHLLKKRAHNIQHVLGNWEYVDVRSFPFGVRDREIEGRSTTLGTSSSSAEKCTTTVDRRPRPPDRWRSRSIMSSGAAERSDQL